MQHISMAKVRRNCFIYIYIYIEHFGLEKKMSHTLSLKSKVSFHSFCSLQNTYFVFVEYYNTFKRGRHKSMFFLVPTSLSETPGPLSVEQNAEILLPFAPLNSRCCLTTAVPSPPLSSSNLFVAGPRAKEPLCIQDV